MSATQEPNLASSYTDPAALGRAVTRSSGSGAELRNRRHGAPETPHFAAQMEEVLTASEAPSERLVWTMAQLLDRLPVSRSTIYRWIEREGLPVVRIGKNSSPLFLPENVLGWLQSREQQNAAATDAPASSDPAFDAMRLADLHRKPRRPRSRRMPPAPIANAGSRERLRRIHGAR